MFCVQRANLKMGDWLEQLQGVNETSIPRILKYYSNASELDKTWYKVRDVCLCVTSEQKSVSVVSQISPTRTYLTHPHVFVFQAWHAWACMNYEAVLFYKNQRSNQDVPQTPGDIGSSAAAAAATAAEESSPAAQDSEPKDADPVQKEKNDLARCVQ